FSKGYDAVIGKTILVGNEHYKQDRVKVFYNDIEVTAPSVNLGYRKDKFFYVGGFNDSFVTAEDIDLNIRSAKAGFKFGYCDQCLVYARVRGDMRSFIRQAFWNGYGRGQLAEKYPDVFSHTMVNVNMDPFNIIRLMAGICGFVYYRITGKSSKSEKK
ncbi:MAG: glycosyltransferase family 2 protein, partial [Thermoplasmata archaeon]